MAAKDQKEVEPILKTMSPPSKSEPSAKNAFKRLLPSFINALTSLHPSPTLIVAVSGGHDSMSLLRLLSHVRGHQLIIAHFNHQLRGPESDADEQFVRSQAALRGLPFIASRGNVRAAAKGISIEMAARNLRHQFLARVAAENHADIVLAHHADDQIELFLMRVERGIEGPGLAGMRPISPSPADPNIRLLRPLLDFTRADLASLQVPFCEDSSNSNLDADRNRFRLVVIPALRKNHGPNFDREILQQISKARALADRLRSTANAWLQNPKDFATTSDFLQREIIATQLDRAQIPITADLLKNLLTPHRRVSISPERTLALDSQGHLQIFDDLWPTNSTTLKLTRPGSVEFESLQLSWSKPTKPNLTPDPQRLTFDADRVGAKIILRHWQQGDRIQLSGRASDRPLHEMFSRNKIPRAQRHRLLLATTADGAIFWVEGLRITEDFKVTAATKRFLEWRWQRRLL